MDEFMSHTTGTFIQWSKFVNNKMKGKKNEENSQKRETNETEN